MALPVATRLVCQALRDEAESFRDPWNPDVQAGIRRALGAVADRLEQAGSSVYPRTPARAPDGPAVSPDASEPAPPDPQRTLGLVGAMLLDFWQQLQDSPYNLPISMRQLLWDAIEQTGDRPPGERPERRR